MEKGKNRASVGSSAIKRRDAPKMEINANLSDFLFNFYNFN